MPKLSSLLKERVRASLPFEGGNIEVVYAPTALSLNDFIRVSRISEAGEQDGVEIGSDIATILSHALIEWDLTNDDDTPIGTDEESLRELPPVIVAEVLSAIFADMNPKAETVSTPSGSPASSASQSPIPPSGGAPAKTATPGQRAPRSSRSTS